MKRTIAAICMVLLASLATVAPPAVADPPPQTVELGQKFTVRTGEPATVRFQGRAGQRLVLSSFLATCDLKRLSLTRHGTTVPMNRARFWRLPATGTYTLRAGHDCEGVSPGGAYYDIDQAYALRELVITRQSLPGKIVMSQTRTRVFAAKVRLGRTPIKLGRSISDYGPVQVLRLGGTRAKAAELPTRCRPRMLRAGDSLQWCPRFKAGSRYLLVGDESVRTWTYDVHNVTLDQVGVRSESTSPQLVQFTAGAGTLVHLETSNVLQGRGSGVVLRTRWGKTMQPKLDMPGMGLFLWRLEKPGTYAFELPRVRKPEEGIFALSVTTARSVDLEPGVTTTIPFGGRKWTAALMDSEMPGFQATFTVSAISGVTPAQADGWIVRSVSGGTPKPFLTELGTSRTFFYPEGLVLMPGPSRAVGTMDVRLDVTPWSSP